MIAVKMLINLTFKNYRCGLRLHFVQGEDFIIEVNH